ncbi:MAG TPA: hypothetical protein VFV32_02680 [Acidimicrobiales bacterium]|nr:hypothetical protein [Acidimicrobiales bacterium]
MPRRTPALLLAALVTIASGSLAGCSDDEMPPATTASTSTPSSTAPEGSTDGAADEALEALLLDASDLPAGFTASDEADDTITSFCATQDAAAGLQASARAVRAFARDAGGASVIQLAFRFRDGGAATFVQQAETALATCTDIPDASGTGLAFEYEPLSPDVAAAVAAAGDSRTGRYGTSVGSGNLTVEVVVLQHDDIGILVAVLGLSQPRTELDALAATAFTAVAQRL